MRIDGSSSLVCRPDEINTTSVALAPLTWDMPTGLPFLGPEPPACAEPTARKHFETAGNAHGARNSIRACKRTCMECPYLVACRDWAIAEREPWGVWGGMTPRERRRAVREASRG